MKTRKISIATKLFISVILAVVITAGFLGVISYSTLNKQLKSNAQHETLNIARIAATSVDGDEFQDILEQGTDSKYYSKNYNILSAFLESGNVEYIYTMAPLDDSHLQFIIDTDPEDPADFGEEYDAEVEMKQALNGKPSVTKEMTVDEWGQNYSSYAPIMNSNGEIIAIVGVDCDASSVSASASKLLLGFLIAIIISAVFAIVVAYTIAKVIRVNFNKIDNAILEVASDNGDLTQTIEVSTGDEFEVISNDLNKLLIKTRDAIAEISSGSSRVESVVSEINNDISESGEHIESISDTMNTMVASSEEIAASISDAKIETDGVLQHTERIVEITKRNGEEIAASEASARRLSSTATQSSATASTNVQQMQQQLEVEEEKSKAVEKIHQLSDAILSISGQTNLLALNASIEAARAGEAGRGFAVVASEISDLAAETNTAANEIQQVSSNVMEAIRGLNSIATEMLAFIQDTVLADYENFANISNEFTDQTVSMGQNMDEMRSIIEEFYTSVSKIQQSMESVQSASEENSNEVAEISSILTSLSQMMQTEQETTRQTLQTVSDMNESINQFQV